MQRVVCVEHQSVHRTPFFPDRYSEKQSLYKLGMSWNLLSQCQILHIGPCSFFFWDYERQARLLLDRIVTDRSSERNEQKEHFHWHATSILKLSLVRYSTVTNHFCFLLHHGKHLLHLDVTVSGVSLSIARKTHSAVHDHSLLQILNTHRGQILIVPTKSETQCYWALLGTHIVRAKKCLHKDVTLS